MYQWPVSKLDLINRALSQLGDNLCNVAEDGSDEWNTASPAYEEALPRMMEAREWKSATIVAVGNASTTPPTDDQFDTAIVKPADLIHLIWVRLNDLPIVYQILNNQIVLNQFGQAPGIPPPSGATPGVVTIKYVSMNNADPTLSTPTFVSCLQAYVMSGIYRGLHEDTVNADKMLAMAEALLQQASTRSDQEQPKRAMFNSRISASRRVRRPFPQVPTGWGGTGIPG